MTGAAGAVAAVAATPSMGVTISPPNVAGAYSGTSTAAQDITTSLVLAVVSGGVPSYTYSWSQVGSSPYTWTISAPTGASTTFTAENLAVGASAIARFKVTVTDAAGVVATATVDAEAINNSTG